MFAVGVSDHIMIAHSFADPYFGKAQATHGATYTIEAEVRSPRLGPHHVVMDIGALCKALRHVLDGLDYSNLDEHAAFPGRTSTTERVAEYVGNCLADRLRELPEDASPPTGAVVRVLARESPVAWVTFERPL